MSLSIKGEPLTDSDFLTDSTGRELNRPTATGEFDVIYKCLIELREKRHLTDDEYFPKYVKAHLDRGAVYLEREKRYAKDLLVHLSELDKTFDFLCCVPPRKLKNRSANNKLLAERFLILITLP